MKKYLFMHGFEVQDNDKTVTNKLTVQETITENKKGSIEEIKKMQERLFDIVQNYMGSIE